MNRAISFRRWFSFTALLAVQIGSMHFAALAAEATPKAQVRLFDLTGTVEIIRAGTTVGVFTDSTNQPPLQVGDRLRTGKQSRAVLLFADQSVVPLGPSSDVEVISADEAKGGLVVNLWKGVLYFFHRGEAGRARIITRGAPAGIEGTEVVVEVADVGNSEETRISVIDGKVRFGEGAGSLLLTSGESATAVPGQAPQRAPGFIVNNVLQWCFYYPGVLDVADLAFTQDERNALSESLAAYRAGDLLGAIKKFPSDRKNAGPSEIIYHAALLLAVGEVKDAEAMLLTSTDASDSRTGRLAQALREMIAAVKRQEWKASQASELPSELLAASYYEQSKGVRGASLEAALKLARQAAEKSPEFGFAWERVAELEFSFGRTARTRDALEKSLALSPRNAQAIALRGFLIAAENHFQSATEQFDKAIAADPRLANAWLGRGLSRIRRGDLAGGREDLLVAAALEPQRASLRSYLGKAFAVSRDYKRAEHEFELAKGLDVGDPTAWLYSALLDEEQNRLNDAVRDLEKSQDLNNNRRVYRSSMLLDTDRAVRQANLARIYSEAGLAELALPEAGQAVVNDYANYSAHLFLANAYQEQRPITPVSQRFETPAVSEYLIAALMGPADGRILAPQVTQQEYSRLFDRDSLGLSSSTEYLTRGAWAQYGVQYGTFGNTSYALEVNYVTDPGQVANTRYETRGVSAKVKQNLTDKDSIFIQFFAANLEGEDIAQRYDPSTAVAGSTFRDNQSPAFLLGYHHEWSPTSHTLLLGSYVREELTSHTPFGNAWFLDVSGGAPISVFPTDLTRDYSRVSELKSIEVQQQFTAGWNQFIAGARLQTFDQNITNNDLADNYNLSGGINAIYFPATPFSFPTESLRIEGTRATAYAYDSVSLGETVRLYGGVSVDWLTLPKNDIAPPLSAERDHQSKILPAAGFSWQPRREVLAQASWARAKTGESFDQSVRLEPTQFAGQPLTFRGAMPDSLVGGIAGEEIEIWQATARFEFLDHTYFIPGARLIESKAQQEVGAYAVDAFSGSPTIASAGQSLKFRERAISASLMKLFNSYFTASVRYELSKSELDENLNGIDPAFLASPASQSGYQARGTLQTVSLDGIVNAPCGFFFRANGTYTVQNGLMDTNMGGELPDDRFWQVNLYAGYRSPRRWFEGQIGLLNVFDQNYRLHPIDLWSNVPRSRTVSMLFRFNF